jgi:DNA-binding transcriptional regulator of glucitol operon
MNFIVVLGMFGIGAYLLQIVFGMKQIKHFNETYQMLRRKGKVAIGRRAGKIKAGNIVMFAVNNNGDILESVKMQGVTVMAKFKSLPQFNGLNIHDLSENHDLVAKENKLMQQAIMNAREIYIRVEAGNYVEDSPVSPLMNARIHMNIAKESIQKKLKRGVE